MRPPVEIRGVWLLKKPAHLGNTIAVVVMLGDGTERQVITEVADDGPISHWVDPATILNAPVLQLGDRLIVDTPDRCPSCDHSRTQYHRGDGCWYTVTVGGPGSNLVCPCAVPGAPPVVDPS